METLDILPSPASEGLREIVAKRFKVNREVPSGLSRLDGKPVGYLKKTGYWTLCVRVEGKAHYLSIHRIVWELANGPVPDGLQIDHIDRNRQNNLIENLRVVTSAENNQNKDTFRTNKLGLKHINKRHDRDLYTVSVRKFGRRYTSYHKSLDEAVAARDKLLSELQ